MRLIPRQLRTTTPHPRSQWLGAWAPTTPQTPSNSAVSWNVDACTILPQSPGRPPSGRLAAVGGPSGRPAAFGSARGGRRPFGSARGGRRPFGSARGGRRWWNPLGLDRFFCFDFFVDPKGPCFSSFVFVIYYVLGIATKLLKQQKRTR